ncbi:hypothetical protein DSO57_1016894 [Entomophthora muscae]|uniref:Uncharacterized protein n=1 Tax=Entomophthora muscae TaxID=34485 RepID=A0ACC2SI30_9FUNG|nr:hypothetical protein DSO57_1016894 [Entomophthora muscae]
MPLAYFILEEICQYLDVKHTRNLRRVSKYWHGCLTPAVFGCIKIRHRLTFEDRRMVERHGQLIRTLHMKDQLFVLDVLEDLSDDAHLFPGVPSLHVTIDCGEKVASLHKLCSQLPSLKCLAIAGVFTNLPKYFTFPTIHTLCLDIHACGTINKAVEKIRFPSLRALSLACPYGYSFNREALIAMFPTLARFQSSSSTWIHVKSPKFSFKPIKSHCVYASCLKRAIPGNIQCSVKKLKKAK